MRPTVKCPKCNIPLVTEDADLQVGGKTSNLYDRIFAICPTCKKTFFYTAIYSFAEITDFHEAKENENFPDLPLDK
jgi:uncharacterized protein with PIN domain